LSTEDKPEAIGAIRTSQQAVANYFAVNDNLVCCHVDETGLTMNDLDNFAQVIFAGLAPGVEMYILHSEARPSASFGCLKSSAWTQALPEKHRLRQPSLVTGVSAALLTLAELRQVQALLVSCSPDSRELDSVSLSGFKAAFHALSEMKLQEANVIKARLQRLHQAHSLKNLLYI
jgi:hypothetical protein